MAVPTITTVSPTVGVPTGGALVEIVGTNFRLPTPPGLVIPAPEAPPSMRVLIGGVAVVPWVLSTTRLAFPLPKRALPVGGTGNTSAQEVVLIRVENIDDAGLLIPGEFAVLADAFTYRRPSIGYDNQGAVVRATAALTDLLRSEVLANTVAVGTAFDFDPDTTTPGIEVGTTPQLVLAGPSVQPNPFFTYRGSSLKLVGPEGHRVRRTRVVDLQFEIIGVTNSTVELLNLIELVETAVDHNPSIAVTTQHGTVTLELWLDTAPQYEAQTGDAARSDLRVFRGAVSLRGLPLVAVPGTSNAVQELGYEVDDADLAATAQIGENLPASHGALTRSPGNTPTIPPGRAQGAPTRAPGDVPLPSSNPPHGAPTRSPPDGAEQ